MNTPSTPPWEQPGTTGQEERAEPVATPRPAEFYVPSSERPPADPSQTAELLVTPADEPTFTPAGPGGTTRGAEPVWVQLLRKPTLGQAVVLVTGFLLFIWGFLPWYSGVGVSANAWSTVTIPGLVMTATWVPLLSLAAVVFGAIKVFGDGFPDKVLGFTWAQLFMVVGLFDILITVGFMVAHRQVGNFGSLSLGAGLILSFITSLILLAGALFDHLGMDTETFNRRLGRR